MVRERRPKKKRSSRRAGKATELALRKSVGVVVAIFFAAFVIVLLHAFLTSSDYFRLKNIDTRDCFIDQKSAALLGNQLINNFKGRNVFKLNLRGIQAIVQSYYPDAKDVIVSLALPDRLVINMKFRKPVAVISSGQLYPIDEDGYVFRVSDQALLKDLPIIDGVNVKYDSRMGRNSASRNIRLAIALLKELARSKIAASHKVDLIKAHDASSLSFTLRGGPEIRIGFENFRERLSILEDTLRDPRILIDKIEYIDLRFKDVVVGPK